MHRNKENEKTTTIIPKQEYNYNSYHRKAVSNEWRNGPLARLLQFQPKVQNYWRANKPKQSNFSVLPSPW